MENLSKAIRAKLSDWDVEISEIRKCLDYLLGKDVKVDERLLNDVKRAYLGILIECKSCGKDIEELLKNYENEIERSIRRGTERGYIYKPKGSKLYYVEL